MILRSSQNDRLRDNILNKKVRLSTSIKISNIKFNHFEG